MLGRLRSSVWTLCVLFIFISINLHNSANLADISLYNTFVFDCTNSFRKYVHTDSCINTTCRAHAHTMLGVSTKPNAFKTSVLLIPLNVIAHCFLAFILLPIEEILDQTADLEPAEVQALQEDEEGLRWCRSMQWLSHSCMKQHALVVVMWISLDCLYVMDDTTHRKGSLFVYLYLSVCLCGHTNRDNIR